MMIIYTRIMVLQVTWWTVRSNLKTLQSCQNLKISTTHIHKYKQQCTRGHIIHLQFQKFNDRKIKTCQLPPYTGLKKQKVAQATSLKYASRLVYIFVLALSTSHLVPLFIEELEQNVIRLFDSSYQVSRRQKLMTKLQQKKSSHLHPLSQHDFWSGIGYIAYNTFCDQ